jgi:uncharacterized membrane protein
LVKQKKMFSFYKSFRQGYFVLLSIKFIISLYFSMNEPIMWKLTSSLKHSYTLSILSSGECSFLLTYHKDQSFQKLFFSKTVIKVTKHYISAATVAHSLSLLSLVTEQKKRLLKISPCIRISF